MINWLIGTIVIAYALYTLVRHVHTTRQEGACASCEVRQTCQKACEAVDWDERIREALKK